MKYPKLSAADQVRRNSRGELPVDRALDLIQNAPHEIYTDVLTAGATGETKTDYVFVAPTKCQILKAQFLTKVVQTGADNTPVANIKNGSDVVGATAAIALGGAIGDVEDLVLDADYVELAEGDKLTINIVNPTATITVALQGKFQIIWKSVV